MTMHKLTDAKCKSAKPTQSIWKLFDGGGLYLAVTPSGGKLWRIAYRVDGKPQTASLGGLEIVSLKEARQLLNEFKINLRKGIVFKAVQAPIVKTVSFNEVWDKYWATRLDLSTPYFNSIQKVMKNHISPEIGDNSIQTIDRKMILDMLMKLDQKGYAAQVRNTKLYCNQVFEYAVIQDLISINPCVLIKSDRVFVKKTTVGNAALDLKEVHIFMEKLDGQGATTAAQLTRFLSLTALRTQEARLLKFSHIEGSIAVIPAGNMKKRREHIVLLSTQALAIIKHMKARQKGNEYVFPHPRQLDSPLGPGIVLQLIDRIGYKGKMTGHGFRSLFSTWANDREYNADVIEMQLAHISGNVVRSAYNRAKYLPQRTKLLQDWADWLFLKDPLPQGSHGTTNASSDSNAHLVEELAPH